MMFFRAVFVSMDARTALFCAFDGGETRVPNAKVLEQKKAVVAELTEKLKGAAGGGIVDYKGITVAEDTALRSEMRKNGVEYAVVKNTLTRFAAQNAGLEGLSDMLNGTTSLAISAEDPVAPARVVAEFAKKMNGQKFAIKAGFVDGKIINVAEVNALAELPSKEVLLSMLLSAMQGPVRGLAVSLDATITGLARSLQAVADQKSAG